MDRLNNNSNKINETDKSYKNEKSKTDSLENDINNQKRIDQKFWFIDPKILIDTDEMFSIWPSEDMSYNQKLNSLSRLVIYITLIGIVFTQSLKFLISGIITLGVFVFLYYSLKKNNEENFSNLNSIINICNLTNLTNRFTMPAKSNPIMNVMLPEINDNPTRNRAAPSYNTVIEEKINSNTQEMIIENLDPKNIYEKNNIRDKLFSNLEDENKFNDSMRIFNSMPNTTIPNDQGGFLDFCFGNMISCKEGNIIACERNNPRHIQR